MLEPEATGCLTICWLSTDWPDTELVPLERYLPAKSSQIGTPRPTNNEAEKPVKSKGRP